MKSSGNPIGNGKAGNCKIVNSKAANGVTPDGKLSSRPAANGKTGNVVSNGTFSRQKQFPVANTKQAPVVNPKEFPGISKGQSPNRGTASAKKRPISPFRRPLSRRLGTTPPPAELNEQAAEQWNRYNKILESIGRDDEEEKMHAARPPTFDYRGVEMIAALAPALGKFLFLAKAKSFSWWKMCTIKVRTSNYCFSIIDAPCLH